MATMFIRHRVADYAKWRKTYDGFAPTRKKLGVQAAAVYQAIGDPRDLTVTHDFATAEAAHAFAGSAELREAMAAAGVEGAPTIWFTWALASSPSNVTPWLAHVRVMASATRTSSCCPSPKAPWPR